MKTDLLPQCAPIVLRLSLAAVFTWFGMSQVIAPNSWTGMVPAWTHFSGLTALTIVQMNGYFEIIASMLLAIGFLTRWIALALSVHLGIITFSIGMNPIGVRDFGLTFAMLAVALQGNDHWSLTGNKAT